MRRRSLITFIIMNVLISLGVAFGVISYFGDREQTSSGVQVVTVEIRVTTTPNPEVSPQVLIVTATPLAGTEVAVLPTGLFDDLQTPDLTRSPAPTIDPAIIGEDADLQGTATALPENCIPYALKDGDTPFGIAEEFGADGFLLMEINGLDDTSASLLQIGDVLIVPLTGCSLTAADVVGDEAASALSADDEEAVEETEEPTEGPSSTPSRTPIRTNTPTPTFTPSQTSTPSDTPTVTLPPTAANAQIEITGITSPGDVTAEAVTIRNNGNTVDVTGWTLRDNDGNAYTFPEQILFSNATVTIYTRVGDNTPIALYWGRSQGVWGQEGDVITLANEDGLVQSTLRVP